LVGGPRRGEASRAAADEDERRETLVASGVFERRSDPRMILCELPQSEQNCYTNVNKAVFVLYANPS
ncbi:Uncharacterized protein FKW44_024916, partial [Caligus rogercresseyi]